MRALALYSLKRPFQQSTSILIAGTCQAVAVHSSATGLALPGKQLKLRNTVADDAKRQENEAKTQYHALREEIASSCGACMAASLGREDSMGSNGG